ncbi:MAG: hypothetical protein QXU16_01085 [Candidatus Micrarchaeaceae archaeon]
MKVLLVSNMPNGADAISAEFESLGVNIVEKEVAGTLDTISGIINETAQSGNYDSILVITDNHISAGIELNKNEGIRAAVCSVPRDVPIAAKSNANVIVVSKDGDMRGIAKAVVDSLGRQRKINVQAFAGSIKKQTPKPTQTDMIENKNVQIQHPKVAGSRTKAGNEEEERSDEEYEEPLKKPRSGLFGRIKDALGIEDKDGGKEDNQ